MIVLKLKKKNTGPDNIIEHFNCLKGNIRARYILRTFMRIVSAHPYCACKFACHVMHERALSNKINK